MLKWGWFQCDCCEIFAGQGGIILNEKKGIFICFDCIEELYKDNFKPIESTKDILIIRKTIKEELRNKIFERDNYKCIQCFSNKNLQIDHITPFSKGGRTEENNLQTLCKSCNSKKGDKTLEVCYG